MYLELIVKPDIFVLLHGYYIVRIIIADMAAILNSKHPQDQLIIWKIIFSSHICCFLGKLIEKKAKISSKEYEKSESISNNSLSFIKKQKIIVSEDTNN